MSYYKTVNIGQHRVRVVGESTPVVFFDWITECRPANGTIAMSFGAIIKDEGAENNDIAITSRIRCSVVTAQLLRDALSRAIDDALKPTVQPKAN